MMIYGEGVSGVPLRTISFHSFSPSALSYLAGREHSDYCNRIRDPGSRRRAFLAVPALGRTRFGRMELFLPKATRSQIEIAGEFVAPSAATDASAGAAISRVWWLSPAGLILFVLAPAAVGLRFYRSSFLPAGQLSYSGYAFSALLLALAICCVGALLPFLIRPVEAPASAPATVSAAFLDILAGCAIAAYVVLFRDVLFIPGW